MRLRLRRFPDPDRPRPFRRLRPARARRRQALEDDWLAARRAHRRVAGLPIGVDVSEFERLTASAEARRQADDLQRTLGEPGPDHRRRPARLQQGHPRAAARLPRAAERIPAAPAQGRADADLGAQPRGPARIPRHAPLDRAPGRAHQSAATARPTGSRCATSTAPIPAARSPGSTALARVGLVTPLRDGLNLVAEEYVVAQDAADPGVLVLSRFAGAAAHPARVR